MSSQPPRPPAWWQPDAGGASGSGSPGQPARGQQPYPQQQPAPQPYPPQPYPQQPDQFGPSQQQWSGAPRPPERGRGGRTAAAVVGLVAVAVIGSAGGYWLGHRGSGSTATSSAPVV